MNFDEGVALTQDRLAEMGSTMDQLLGNFRCRISPLLIGNSQWKSILGCVSRLPITMGAFPLGFEVPLHIRDPQADFGASMDGGTRAAAYFQERAANDTTDETARAVTCLFERTDAEHSSLRGIIGRKLMLEYDIGSAPEGMTPLPGIFLRPGDRPIIGGCGQVNDAAMVADALVSCLGWESDRAMRETVVRAYLAQPGDTRMDSFGAFPSRSRAIRLAVMGFESQKQICNYLADIGWSGQIAVVESVISRLIERVNVAMPGINLDAQHEGIGSTLGLTMTANRRYTKDPRYWLDGLTDWEALLEAMSQENLVLTEKLSAVSDWIREPTTLFSKSGRFVVLRGIHHIKLVISANALEKAKAYVFIVISGAGC